MLRLLVSRGLPDANPSKKYNASYQYNLVPRKEGTREYLKDYMPNNVFRVDGSFSADVFIGDLKDLTPFSKSYISSKLSTWKTQFDKMNK